MPDRLFEFVFFRLGIVSGLLQLFLFCLSSVSSASSVVFLPRLGSDRHAASVRSFSGGSPPRARRARRVKTEEVAGFVAVMASEIRVACSDTAPILRIANEKSPHQYSLMRAPLFMPDFVGSIVLVRSELDRSDQQTVGRRIFGQLETSPASVVGHLVKQIDQVDLHSTEELHRFDLRRCQIHS